MRDLGKSGKKLPGTRHEFGNYRGRERDARQIVGAGTHEDDSAGSLAPRIRFERTTCPLGGDCSIQLSYRGWEEMRRASWG